MNYNQMLATFFQERGTNDIFPFPSIFCFCWSARGSLEFPDYMSHIVIRHVIKPISRSMHAHSVPSLSIQNVTYYNPS